MTIELDSIGSKLAFQWLFSDTPLTVLSIPVVLKWQFIDTGLAVKWHVVVHWHPIGSIKHSSGTQMTVKWHWIGSQLAFMWQFSGTPLVLLIIPVALKWQFSDTGLAVNLHYSQVAVQSIGIPVALHWHWIGNQLASGSSVTPHWQS